MLNLRPGIIPLRLIAVFIVGMIVSQSGLMADDHEKSHGLELMSAEKIWDQAPHNAFTSLAYFKGKWYCGFREARGHGVSLDGSLRLLSSEDGKMWESVKLFTDENSDLRDADLSVTRDGRLLLAGVRAYPSGPAKHQSVVFLSEDGKTWTEGIDVADKNVWLWSVSWRKDAGYGIGYSTISPKFARLYKTNDGESFESWVDDLKIDAAYPNESSIVFNSDGTAYCLLRCDPEKGYIGTAKAPYKKWTWTRLDRRIGGPKMIQLPDGRLLCGVRLYDGGARTSLCFVDPKTGEMTEEIKLPSGGDTSYPGMVYRDGVVYVSYYASHEGKSSIYFATVKIDASKRVSE